ncbi:hypothetical protein E1B28_006701 [Marasmius oreades]|uniref:F-box domain-containing protein n=1 Tax=Marasmius oreades TaxID=181124 RepID=A0A9P7UWP7_9AGAR|nr:uncharacterized protein E1B28_006701 [Marasmius oreades]KAG7096018.1 hypothetical protein E1B28_006701 [Marasmius oreades]
MEQIPNEVFRIIFLLSAFQNPRHDGTSSFDGLADSEITEGQTWPGIFQFSKGPWAISRVCRKWRTISVTFPQLWSHFSLMTGDLNSNTDGIPALTTWLSFSGTSNLSFFIEPDGICNNPNRSRLFELLAEHADRWDKIEFYNSTPAFWSMLHTANARSRLGSLTSIAIHSEEANLADDAFFGDPTFYQVFLDAPQLHILINRNHLPVGGLEFPWGQLTEYEGSHRLRVDEHLDLLRLTPNIQKCRLEIAYVGNPSPDDQLQPSRTIHLPNLQTLQIRTTWFSDSLQDLPVFVRLLRLPALQTLHIITEHISQILPPFSAFADVLRSSSCELRSLELSSRAVAGVDHLRSEDILDLLKAAPALRHLCITVGTSGSSCVLQDTIIPRLDPRGRSEDDILVPVLEELELRLPSPSAIPMIDLKALAETILFRSTASGFESIRKLHFTVGLGDTQVNNDVLSSAIRGPIIEVLEGGEEVEIDIETQMHRE